MIPVPRRMRSRAPGHVGERGDGVEHLRRRRQGRRRLVRVDQHRVLADPHGLVPQVLGGGGQPGHALRIGDDPRPDPEPAHLHGGIYDRPGRACAASSGAVRRAASGQRPGACAGAGRLAITADAAEPVPRRRAGRAGRVRHRRRHRHRQGDLPRSSGTTAHASRSRAASARRSRPRRPSSAAEGIEVHVDVVRRPRRGGRARGSSTGSSSSTAGSTSS